MTLTTEQDALSIETEIILLTPQKAHEFLASNTHNRDVSQSIIDQYAGAIKRGEWRLSDTAISFDKNGVMLNGQHRCFGVIKAGEPIMVSVMRGLDPEAQETMDGGAKRTLSADLKLRGEKDYTALAGTLNVLYSYVKAGTLYSGALTPTPTKSQLIAFLNKHPDIRDHIRPPYSKRAVSLLTPSTASAIYYLTSLADTEDADIFFARLSSGKDIQEGDPIWALRERLLREQSKVQGRITATVRAALSVKAWNIWREGRSVYTLKWTGGGGRPEVFPRVADCPLTPEIDR